MSKKVIVIGSGFSSLSTACYLAKVGYEVEVYEKNETLGGRARVKKIDGFTFDMGPSWYWMPDVFDSFFNDFGKQTSDYYNLVRLSPSYKVFWKENSDEIPFEIEKLVQYFESYEKGAGKKLIKYLDEAKKKYEIGMGKFVNKPALSISEFISKDIIINGLKLDIFKSMSKHIRQFFNHPKLITLMEFPVLFLGAKPQNTPAMYSLMNYADMGLGTWYPLGGMGKIIEGMVKLAKELGVKFFTNSAVNKILIEKNQAVGIEFNNEKIEASAVISGADYNHTEQKLLPKKYRNYSEKYWENRVLAPSSILFYVGLNKKIKGLQHHNLFFDENFEIHAQEIYDSHSWPQTPLFYLCNPSKTDQSVSPEGKDNLFILIPTSTQLENENKDIIDHYFNLVCDRLEMHIGEDIKKSIIVYESFAKTDFISEYNSFKGNAYGLANTLKQTAFLKPKIRNKKVRNLFYTGQLTVPGPGVPPALISGKIASKLVINFLNKEK